MLFVLLSGFLKIESEPAALIYRPGCQVLGRAAVVCATLTGVLAHDLRDVAFNVVVVDEAAQVPPGVWRLSSGSAPACCIMLCILMAPGAHGAPAWLG